MRYLKGYQKYTDKGLPDLKSKKVTVTHIEYLECGHQNNLKLPDRESGKCPKGCNEVVQIPETQEA